MLPLEEAPRSRARTAWRPAMRARLAWSGGLPDALALERLVAAGAEVALAPRPGALPAFVLEEQAACLGLAWEPAADARPPPEPQGDAEDALARGWRAVLVRARPPVRRDALGRVVDAALVEELRALRVDPLADVATAVFDGPLFRRRAGLVAGEVVPDGDGWRLDVGLRGC